MNEHDRKILDDTLELVGQHETRITALEAAPPGQWARSVAYLIDRYVTMKNMAKVSAWLAGFYAAIWSAVNGVPGV